MGKLVVTNKKGKITIINKISYPESVNQKIYDAIQTGYLEGFLRMSIRQKKKETRLECVMQGYIPLNQYFSGIVNKKMFLDFVHEIALHIKTCDKNTINPNNLDLQSDKIFVEPQTKKVMCILWPIVNNQRSTPPEVFLKQLPFELNFYEYEDKEYIEVYKAFFNSIEPFSVNNFDKMILKLMGKKQNDGADVPSEALTGNFGDKTKEEKEGVKEKKVIEYDPFGEDADDGEKEEMGFSKTGYIYCSKCGKKSSADANYCMKCGEKLQEKIEEVKEEASEEEPEKENEGEKTVKDRTGGLDPDTVVLGAGIGTVVLGWDDEDEVEVAYPKFTRLKTEEVYEINKPSYRIGTEKEYSDLFINDNTYISRSHADIITRDDRYYIKDLNSTNKTFVDGKAISANVEIEIFDGTKIRLSNEEFVFNIE